MESRPGANSRLALTGEKTDELDLCCKLEYGHRGMHFADLRVNGIDCETPCLT